MKKIFKYIISSVFLFASFFNVAMAQLTEAEKALVMKSVIVDKKTSPGSIPGTYYLNLETFVTGYESNKTTITTTTESTPLDIVLLLDVSGSMADNKMSDGKTRMKALQDAVTTFIGTIQDDGSRNKVDHRISLVKFSMDKYPTNTIEVNSTSYYLMKSAPYSYNGYGDNSYYYKDGENYRQVKRESEVGVGSEIYSAQNQAVYTYNGFTNNKYYYLHEGQYCLVEKGGTSNNRNLHFTYNGTTYYLIRNGSGTNPGGKVSETPESGRNDTKNLWQGVLYTKENATVYRLYYQDASNVKHYLSGTETITAAPTSVEGPDDTIWTGVLYIADTANMPTNIILGNDTYKYSNSLPNANYTQVVNNFTIVNESGATTLKNSTAALKAQGGTMADYGMNLVKLVFQGARDNAIKVLILFTDGDPGMSSFDTKVANSVINSSRVLKKQGVKVYTIGTFDTLNDNRSNYMNNTSSNFPDATSLTSSGDRGSGDYYFNVTSAASLNSVFETITKNATDEVKNNNAGYTEATTENNVTVKDIVTSDFVVPTGADGNIDLSKIEIYTQKSKGVTHVQNFNPNDYAYTEDGYSWEDPVLSDLEPKATRNDNKTTVSVPGFNFSEYWVGWQDEYLNGQRDPQKSKLHEGYKLIIKILVEPDPSSVGGEVYTNTDASGLYITKNGEEIMLKKYDVPDPVKVPMDLTIVMKGKTAFEEGEDRKNGALYTKGETAVFEVSNYNGSMKWTVAVTADADGEGSATIKVPFTGVPANDTYTVRELPEWSYRFDSKPDADKHISGEIDGLSVKFALEAKKHTFYFVATDTEEKGEDTVSKFLESFAYDEANENNKFKPAQNSSESRNK